mgnify:CR=1 FL=1
MALQDPDISPEEIAQATVEFSNISSLLERLYDEASFTGVRTDYLSALLYALGQLGVPPNYVRLFEHHRYQVKMTKLLLRY